MTDEELKHNLLAPIGAKVVLPGYILINPDGPAAWNRIEELKERIEEIEAQSVIQETFYKNRIEELEAWKLEVDHRLVSAGCNTADSYSTPADALDVLIKQEIALANDPLIKERADDGD